MFKKKTPPPPVDPNDDGEPVEESEGFKNERVAGLVVAMNYFDFDTVMKSRLICRDWYTYVRRNQPALQMKKMFELNITEGNGRMTSKTVHSTRVYCIGLETLRKRKLCVAILPQSITFIPPDGKTNTDFMVSEFGGPDFPFTPEQIKGVRYLEMKSELTDPGILRTIDKFKYITSLIITSTGQRVEPTVTLGDIVLAFRDDIVTLIIDTQVRWDKEDIHRIVRKLSMNTNRNTIRVKVTPVTKEDMGKDPEEHLRSLLQMIAHRCVNPLLDLIHPYFNNERLVHLSDKFGEPRFYLEKGSGTDFSLTLTRKEVVLNNNFFPPNK